MKFIKNILVYILLLESRLIISKYKPFIVAVTGSVGKTSTKDAIFCVLKDQSKYVRKSEKSMNSEIGLPLTIIGVPNAWKSISGWIHNVSRGLSLILWKNDYPDCLVLEIGADHPGDIKKIAKWLRPDISVITKVSKTPVHVEFFTSPEQVFEEKAALAEAVRDGGSLILFGDDASVSGLSERVKDRGVNVFRYGTTQLFGSAVMSKGFEIVYKSVDDIRYPDGIKFNMELISTPDAQGVLNTSNGSVTISNVIGETYQYPILAAAAVGMARGMSTEKIISNLQSYNAPLGRMNLVRGINNSTIIDDTYNSSPDATISALKALKSIETNGSRIAILGDMMELGKYATDEHRKVGREAALVANTLITVGPRSRATGDEAIRSGMDSRKVFSYDSTDDVINAGVPIVSIGDIVLVKGSQSVRIERIVKSMLANPDQAYKLLVRQEDEWLEKK